MTCPDVEQLLDAFVDTELPPPQLLDVARHAATCPGCDGTIRALSELRASVAALVEREARQLDLSRVWPAVEKAIRLRAPRRARIAALRRASPSAPLWAGLMALAASLFFWFSGPSTQPLRGKQIAMAPTRAARSFNHADIDRLAGKDIAVRREHKSGTTIIWVNHTVEEGR
jgi:anti-sigma factor RsiW